LASDHSDIDEPSRQPVGHRRLGVVVPIGVTVAIAIICIVVAVLGSARRADQVALDTERELFGRALAGQGEQIMRELDVAAASEAANRNIRTSFDLDWAQIYFGQQLHSRFGHDLVFVTGPDDRILFASSGDHSTDATWLNSIRAQLQPTLDRLHGRAPGGSASALSHIARVQQFLGRPAIVAAAAISNREAATRIDDAAPTVLSVKFIDENTIADIGSRLQLHNLRRIGDPAASDGDFVYDVTDDTGATFARFAWTPNQPGAEIVNTVAPFILLALGGFALLAGLVLRHMGRTEKMIESGESRLRDLAMRDSLSGLPNRVHFGERLEATIEEVRNGGDPAAVLYIDLDHFKDVNDTLGHPVGDELIRCVTKRLSSAVRSGDLVARIGGDEFAMITGAGADLTAQLAAANRIIATICAPYIISHQTIVIGASIGIARIDAQVVSSADVMRYADMALYRAKNEGRNRACVYDNAMDADLLKRKLVESELRLAIQRNELHIAYQPIVNNSGTAIIAVEALCRWSHPERGEIPPSDFIPIAETSGLIIELGEWVLRRACLDGKAWPGINISVNVSALQFRRTDFVDIVERVISDTEFDPTRLELEVTETTLIGNVETAELAMFRLKALGARLSLDDFGTGYSSLLYLRCFPFDRLKIDRSFVGSIEEAADAAAIVHAVVSLGRGLGMKVTAEGVETAEQQLFLRAAGVHAMQGYRFGKPCPASEISRRLAKPKDDLRGEDELALAG
jgi:diguanylate cyclase (GGDEF)-like protein